MKFIVIEDMVEGEQMFLFPSTITHKDMAARVGGPNAKVVSAGIVISDDPGTCPLHCVGESTTLRVESRVDKDDALLRATMQTYC